MFLRTLTVQLEEETAWLLGHNEGECGSNRQRVKLTERHRCWHKIGNLEMREEVAGTGDLRALDILQFRFVSYYTE